MFFKFVPYGICEKQKICTADGTAKLFLVTSWQTYPGQIMMMMK